MRTFPEPPAQDGKALLQEFGGILEQETVYLQPAVTGGEFDKRISVLVADCRIGHPYPGSAGGFG